jgi:hypothetical protein
MDSVNADKVAVRRKWSKGQQRKTRRHAGQDIDTPERDRRREELLRPWPTLGYEHDQIAMHLISREAFKVAEAELRRAVWLNPYEARFKVHLAWCLCREKRFTEAREWIEQVPPECMVETVANIKRVIEEGT